jgi:hypothetical protein
MSRAAAVARPARALAAPLAARTTAMVVGLALLARLLSLEVGGLAFLYLPHAWLQLVPGEGPPAGTFWFQTLIGPWAHWDGYWYLSVAHLGYAGRTSAAAFFPLYPYLLRLMGDSTAAAIAFSTACYTAAAVLLYRLTAEELTPAAAWGAVLGLAFFPTAFYFNAVYPEAVVLLLSVLSFTWARHQRYGLAGLAAGVAAFGSVEALFLGIPLLYYLWTRREAWPRWTALALVPTGLLAFMAVLWARFRAPLEFQAVQGNWGRSFHFFGATMYFAGREFVQYLPHALSFPELFSTTQPGDAISNAWNPLFLAAAICLMWLAIRRLPAPYWLFSLAALILPLSYPSSGVPLMSFPRLMLAAWPLFMALGDFLARRPRAVYPYLWMAGLTGAVLVALFTTAHWVA